jgi:hypothetical protein
MFLFTVQKQRTVIPAFNYCVGIRTRKASFRRSEKASKEKIILGIPEARPKEQGQRGGVV